MRTLLLELVVLTTACATTPPAVGPTFIDGPVGRLHVVRAGAGGTPVVFVHGLGGDTTTWAEAMAHLAPTRQVVAFDARGHGQSVRSAPDTYTIDGWAADVAAVVDSVGAPRVVLVAHSIAGCVLQRYAALHPDRLAGLVYVDAIGDFHRLADGEKLEGYAAHEALPTTLAQREADFRESLDGVAKPETTRRVLGSLAALDPAAWSGFRSGMTRFAAPPAPPPVPTVAIDMKGNTFPVRYAALRTDVEVVPVAGVSHWVMLDDPGAFAAALDGFLARVP